MTSVLALTVVLALAVASPVAADGLRIGIEITPPPPPRIVVTAPPQLVVVPGSGVFYAPGVSINFFAYGAN